MADFARFYPVLSPFMVRILGPCTLETSAVSVEVIAPEEPANMPPVTMFPEDRAKVVAASPYTTLEQQWRRTAGTTGLNTATVRYVLRDVLATPWGIYSWRGAFLRTEQHKRRVLLREEIPHFRKGFYAASDVSPAYFGHWLRDSIPMIPLAREDEALFLPVPADWSHARDYVEALGIERIPADFATFDELAVLDDVGQNAHRRARQREIHRRIQRVIAERLGSLDPAPGVYLARGTTGNSRVLANEEELTAALQARGFAVVAITEPLEEIWRATAGVPRVVTMEGSHWAHAFFAARADALHLTINPADRFNNGFADYMLALGGRLATVVAACEGQDYRVDVDAVLRMLDREAPGDV